MILGWLFLGVFSKAKSLSAECRDNSKSFEISLDWMEKFGFDAYVKNERYRGRTPDYITEIGANKRREEYVLLEQSLKEQPHGVGGKELFNFRLEIAEKLFAFPKDTFEVTCYSKKDRGFLLLVTRGKTHRVSKTKFITYNFSDRLTFYRSVAGLLARAETKGAIFSDFRIKNFYLINGDLHQPSLARFHSLYRLKDVARFDLAHEKYAGVKEKIANGRQSQLKETPEGYFDMPVESFWNVANVLMLIKETEKLVTDKVDPKSATRRKRLLDIVSRYPITKMENLPTLAQLQNELADLLGSPASTQKRTVAPTSRSSRIRNKAF